MINIKLLGYLFYHKNLKLNSLIFLKGKTYFINMISIILSLSTTYVFIYAALCQFSSVSSVARSCLTLCDPVNRSTPGLPVHHHLPEFTQTHIHRVSDAIQPSHPLSSPSPDPNPSQHQSLFQ